MGIKNRALLFLVLICCQHFTAFCDTSAIAGDKTPKEAIETQAENFEFQAEIGRLMDIIIHSLYTNKEIFLREVISNASDALDKIRFQAVSEPGVLSSNPELYIEIEFDPNAHTVSIYDSGIGMTKSELINNLGTIAKSGTTNFVQALAQGQSLNLIGQFGVGFYSTFLAGNKVTVITKSNNDDQYIWTSSAAHSFTVVKDPAGPTLKRGTKIIIDLKQDSYEFCEEAKLRELIKRYSEFINFSIKLRVQKEVSKEVEAEEEPVPEKKEGETEPETKKDDLEIKDDEGEKKPKTKTVTEKVWDWEVVNNNKAIWLRPREEITKEDYNNFYKALSKEYDDPMTYIHFNAEGEVEFKSILFIPGHAPGNMYENYYSKLSTLKLYVRRVLINENFEDLLPKYLSFIKGIIDSDDLPINVSRESLQQVKMLKVMGRKLTKKVLEMLKNFAEGKNVNEETDSDEEEEETDDDKKTEKSEKALEREKKKQENIEKYNKFWAEFGKNVKLGIIEDATNRAKLLGLTRWYTSNNITELTSFDAYIKRMKPGQEHIYYLGGESKETLLKSPVLQKLLKKGYEVILLDDPVDDFCMQNIYDYEKKTTINIGKGTFVMPGDDKLDPKKLKALKKHYEPLTNWWKDLLKDKLDQITISERLVDDPLVVVGSIYGHSARQEAITKAQAYGPSNPMASSKRNLEINPDHPVIKELLHRVKNTPDKETEEMAVLLYEAGLLNSGFPLADAREFSTRFFKIFNPAMGISKDAVIEELEVEIDENDDSPDVSTYSTPNGQNVVEERTDNSIKMSFDEPPGFKEKQAEARAKKEAAEREKAEKEGADKGEPTQRDENAQQGENVQRGENAQRSENAQRGENVQKGVDTEL